MLPKTLHQKLLTGEYQLVETLFRDVEVVFLSSVCKPHTTELILLGKIFSAAMCSDDMNCFFSLLKSFTDSFARAHSFPSIVTTFNSTALKVNQTTRDMSFIVFG